MPRCAIFSRAFCLLALGGLLGPAPVAAQQADAERAALAKLILANLKSPKGLALDLGCGDGRLALELARHSQLAIECVAPEAGVVAAARDRFDAAGLYGTRLTATRGSIDKLDYPTYGASLIVCGDELANGLRVDLKEVYRVLSPNGVAWLGQSARAAKTGTPLKRADLEGWLEQAGIASYSISENQGLWARITRPYEPGWDEWTHRGHDPANPFGSKDTVKGPDFKPLWISDFRPGLSSAAVAVGGGRIVLASLEYEKFPETTPYLQVLDAFSGIELWARVGKKELPIDRPTSLYSNRESCSDLALMGDELYLLGGKFCQVFNVNTGKLERALPIPAAAKGDGLSWLYLACDDELLYGGVGLPPGVKTDWNTMLYRGVSKWLFALERKTGKLRWLHEANASTCSLCLGGGRLFYTSDLALHALDKDTGKVAASSKLPWKAGSEVATCSYYRDKVFLLYNESYLDRKGQPLQGAELLTLGHNKRKLDAFTPKTCKLAFNVDLGMEVAGVSFSGARVYGSGQHGGNGLGVADADSGKKLWTLKESFKCTPSLATPFCFIAQRRNFPAVLDLTGPNEPTAASFTSFSGFRPSCSYPGLPAYGMIYVQGEGCACSSPVRGNIALLPGTPGPRDDSERLHKGSAYDKTLVAAGKVWATWRGDAQHSGQTDEQPAAELSLLWQRQLPGQLTPLAAASGTVYCGSSAHKVFALDSDTGKSRWEYLSEGRVPVAPFLSGGRLAFSDEAGWVYCLRAAEGDPIWKFRAALGRERIVGTGSFISRWPARAGVIVDGSTAYFASGLFPDESTCVFAVDVATGKLDWQQEFDTGNKGSRTAGFVPDGAMALANNRLYVPSGPGFPWQVALDDPAHKTSTTSGYHVKGQQLMVAGTDLLAVAPDLQYVHHVHYADAGGNRQLPVVTGDSIYLLSQPLGTQGSFLVAGKRDAYELSQNRLALYTVKKGVTGQDARRWTAWKDQPMNVMIRAGNTLFTGGPNKIYATSTAGKELWSLPVPGNVSDLAFHDGRLYVQTDAGRVLCFAKK